MNSNNLTLKYFFAILLISFSTVQIFGASSSASANDCGTIAISNDDSSITVSGLSAPIVEVNIFDLDYNTTFYCLGTCNATEVVSGLTASTYTLKIKYFDDDYNLICRVDDIITLSGGPCADADMDGICAEDDCDDNDANFPMTAGTPCDDFNSNTINDQIQQDGCTCLGMPLPCTIDNDGDGVCGFEDCDDNNPQFPMAVGTPCDDGDTTTENDEIQSDGCDCAGTPITTAADCDNILVSNDDSSITVSGLSAPIVEVNIFDLDYNTTFYCLGTCNATEVVSGLTASTYTLKRMWHLSMFRCWNIRNTRASQFRTFVHFHV